MKQRKRIAALLAAGVMLFSFLPVVTLGAEEQTTGSLCEHHPAHTAECGYTEGTEGTSCTFVCEICNAQDSGDPTQPENTVTVESVQAMIDSLPGKDEISADNAEDVQAQLTAIDEAIAELTDEETDQLDMVRYLEAADALEGLHEGVAPLSNAVMLADTDETIDKAIMPGTSGILAYPDQGRYDYIYFGTWENNPIQWRVLDDQTNTETDGLFLLTENALTDDEAIKFRDENIGNAWQGSNAQNWCQNFFANNIDTREQVAVVRTTKTDEEFSDYYTFARVENILDGDAIFFLSAEEATWGWGVGSKYFPYAGAALAQYNGNDVSWWLRSPYAGDDSRVSRSDPSRGGSVSNPKAFATGAARPAFNLNLDVVLFTSAAEGGKPEDGLQEVEDYTGDEWKLTLYDSDRSGFTASKVDESTITYSGAKTGANEYISVLIQDNNTKEYTHYGRLKHLTGSGDESGNVDVRLPFDMTNKTLYVFNEQYNGDKMTDYASALKEVDMSQNAYEEQFTSLTPGETYWFDLSDAGIPGTVNTGTEDGAVSVPDTTLTWVPFTYTGTIDAYVLNSSSSGQTAASAEAAGTTDSTGQYGYTYAHSLFIADYAVTKDVSWDALHGAGLIFGMNYTSGGVAYTLRAPSVWSNYTDDGENERGTPENNEWDAILKKGSGYIKNWQKMGSQGQDTCSSDAPSRATRGYYSARYFTWASSGLWFSHRGFRPVLELPNLDTLNSDSLQVVEVEMNGGEVGATSAAVEGPVNLVVKSNENFTAPSNDGLTAPVGKIFGGWLGDDDQTYAPGDAVPSTVTTLTAQWENVPVSYISYYWDENTQALVRSDTETTGSYTLLTADNAATNWTAGWYVVEGTVNLPARVTVNGDVHLILKDGCHLDAGSGGIQVETGNSLTIYAQSEDESTMGRLTATGGYEAAGIGGGDDGAGENITINGGKITATGGNYAAGIGGGDGAAGQGITINGGIVTAAGGNMTTGIGGGYRGDGKDITINGGSVITAGIGGGASGSGKDITINGGIVTTTDRGFGAGIGGGMGGSGENITINGGTVTATGGYEAAGIGGGYGGSANNIIITNGSVKASRISETPTDGNGNEVYLAKLEVQSGVNEVTLDSGAGEKTFKRAGDHPDGDTTFYLYLTGKDHEITVSDTKYKAIWDADSNSFTIKRAVSAPTVTIAETTASSITVEELADKETYGGAEYSLDGRNWQTSNVLTGLHSNTIYTVHARYKGDTIYATSDAGKVEGVSTSAASYTITIPAVTLEAGKADSSASLAVDTEKNFDLGYKGHVDITVKNDSNVTEDAKLNLTRQNDPENHTITSALLVDNKVLGNIQNIVATFKAKTDIPVTISFASPTETNILAGTYSGTITFEVSYTEPKT